MQLATKLSTLTHLRVAQLRLQHRATRRGTSRHLARGHLRATTTGLGARTPHGPGREGAPSDRARLGRVAGLALDEAATGGRRHIRACDGAGQGGGQRVPHTGPARAQQQDTANNTFQVKQVHAPSHNRPQHAQATWKPPNRCSSIGVHTQPREDALRCTHS